MAGVRFRNAWRSAAVGMCNGQLLVEFLRAMGLAGGLFDQHLGDGSQENRQVPTSDLQQRLIERSQRSADLTADPPTPRRGSPCR